MNDLHYVSEHEDLCESEGPSSCSGDTVFEHGVDELAWLTKMRAQEARPIVPDGPNLAQDVWVEFAARDGIMVDAEELTADAKDALAAWFRQRRADARHIDDALRTPARVRWYHLDDALRSPERVHWYHCAPPARQQPSSASSNDADAECVSASGSSLECQSPEAETNQTGLHARSDLDLSFG